MHVRVDRPAPLRKSVKGFHCWTFGTCRNRQTAKENWPVVFLLAVAPRAGPQGSKLSTQTRASRAPTENALSSTIAQSRRNHQAHNGRIVRKLMVVPVLGLLFAYSACGSPSPSPSVDTPIASPTTSPTSSATGSGTTPNCSSEAIVSALPGGATIEKFDCATVDGTEWAAARVSPGPTVFFLQWDGTKWNAQDSDSVCGTASAGLPEVLLAYCEGASSSSASPTSQTTATPTSSPTST